MQAAELLRSFAAGLEGEAAGVAAAVAAAFEVVPRVLLGNCGGNVVRQMGLLRQRHAAGARLYGVDGASGEVVDCHAAQIWDVWETKIQCVKSAFEQCCMVCRVGDLFNVKMAPK